MAEQLTHGITEDTPGNIVLGAGTVHAGLVFNEGEWNYEESILGATQGGNTLTFEPEFFEPEIDGKYVKTKGLKFKIGETASLTANLAEITPQNISRSVIGHYGDSDIEGYDMLVSSAVLTDDHYIKDFAYVGHTVAGDPIIVIFDWASVEGGLSLNGQNSENSTVEVEFQCHASITQSDLRVLPWRIFTPTRSAEGNQ